MGGTGCGVRLGDLVSLTFCTGATAPQSLGPWTIRLTGAQVQVTPNPFAIEGLMAVSSVH